MGTAATGIPGAVMGEDVGMAEIESDWRKYQWPEDPTEKAWRDFAKPGARLPLLWDDGVTMLEIASVGDDGTIELKAAKPE